VTRQVRPRQDLFGQAGIAANRGVDQGAPIDVSYLADTIVMLRFFEAGGAVRRAISVVKKRTGAHETTIREFRIGGDGIRVGEALTEFQGVLTGVPPYVGGGTPLMNTGPGG
jgi:circadian clock protein KaiC